MAVALSLWVVWAWGQQAHEHILNLVRLVPTPAGFLICSSPPSAGGGRQQHWMHLQQRAEHQGSGGCGQVEVSPETPPLSLGCARWAVLRRQTCCSG